MKNSGTRMDTDKGRFFWILPESSVCGTQSCIIVSAFPTIPAKLSDLFLSSGIFATGCWA